VRAAYEAGPTGFGLARLAIDAGIDVQVVAPSKTPRASGDRVKTDRKDAELLARLLLAGQLKPVFVPPDWLQAIRHFARTREHVRRDLGRARQSRRQALAAARPRTSRPYHVEPRAPSLAGRTGHRPSWHSSISSPRSTA
jgi:transposase